MAVTTLLSIFAFSKLPIMKFGVVVFPGSNCDRDIHDALVYDLKQECVMLWHKDSDLSHFPPKTALCCPAAFRMAIICVPELLPGSVLLCKALSSLQIGAERC